MQDLRGLSLQRSRKFEKVDAMFKAALFSILGDNIVDPYMTFEHGKDAWDALEAKFGVSDAGTELYVMEQYYDYKMTDERSVVEQAHEIQSLAKELEQFKCTLPDKFVAGGIIAKLPPSWRNFATSLKHKRQEFSVSDLIGSLHVEEKARAKDTRARDFEGGSSANVILPAGGAPTTSSQRRHLPLDRIDEARRMRKPARPGNPHIARALVGCAVVTTSRARFVERLPCALKTLRTPAPTAADPHARTG
ncbi:hypothetical protein QYE76_023685 [Lolium multiflorum]|uniref:Uncharacterized protein n=1 Tax=Lolium multiflorum TaxID=4521 RepID=A0AAD8VVB4_LOLMU|nr:hypothetical protein QYE76_023685 [Lolium multiflorum]